MGDIFKSIDSVKNEIEDMNYLKRELFYQSGVLPSRLDDEDFFELLKVQKAKSREDRPLSPTEAHARLRNM